MILQIIMTMILWKIWDSLYKLETFLAKIYENQSMKAINGDIMATGKVLPEFILKGFL